MRGKGFLIIVLLGGIGGLGYRYLPSYYNPFAPLQLADPPGWITTFKLQRLTPSQCRELLTAANQQGLISSQPVADSAGECPLSHVVRVRDFGQVKLSSSFLASCPLALRSALFIKSMMPDSNNIAFLSGLIASVPGISALISAPRLGKLGDRIGTERILMATLICAVLLFFAMSWVTTPFQLGLLRFLLGFADGAMLPAVQTLLVKYSSDQITGRIFGYNQSFMYLGNVVGPLMGATVSAMAGFRWVFIATAAIVLINIGQLTLALRRRRNAQKAKGQ